MSHETSGHESTQGYEYDNIEDPHCFANGDQAIKYARLFWKQQGDPARRHWQCEPRPCPQSRIFRAVAWLRSFWRI